MRAGCDNDHMRIILIRHGQTASNIGRYLDTAEPGAPLTDLGHEQAQALPAALEDERIDAIYASTLLRTQQTAQPLAQARGLEVQVRAGLREISAGDLEMANDEDSIQKYLSIAVGWADEDQDVEMPGTGRSGAAVLAEFDSVVDEVLATGGQSAVIISHGAMIRAWAGSRADNLDPGFVAQAVVSNTGIVVLERFHGRWYVLRWQEQAMGGPDVEALGTDGPAAESTSS